MQEEQKSIQGLQINNDDRGGQKALSVNINDLNANNNATEKQKLSSFDNQDTSKAKQKTPKTQGICLD